MKRLQPTKCLDVLQNGSWVTATGNCNRASNSVRLLTTISPLNRCRILYHINNTYEYIIGFTGFSVLEMGKVLFRFKSRWGAGAVDYIYLNNIIIWRKA